MKDCEEICEHIKEHYLGFLSTVRRELDLIKIQDDLNYYVIQHPEATSNDLAIVLGGLVSKNALDVDLDAEEINDLIWEAEHVLK